MRTLVIVVAALMLLGEPTSAQKMISPAPNAPTSLQPPPPSAGEPSSPQQSQRDTSQHSAASDQRGTDQVPLTVKVLPTPKSQAEIDEQERRANEHATNERGLTTATWVLAGFTLLLALIAGGQIALFFWQLRLIRESLDDAKIAANAATVAATAATDQARELKRAADATERSLTELEPAYVAAGIGGTGITPDQKFVVLRASALNYGKTPGFIDYVYYHIGPYGPEDPIGLPITGDGYQANMFVGWIIGPETKRNEEIQTNPPFAVYPLPLTEPLIFHGLVTYSDIFGQRHYCGFAHRINENGSTQPISRVDAYARHD